MCYHHGMHADIGCANGRVREIRLGASGHVEVCIACQAVAIPRAGQYLLAKEKDDNQVVLSTPLHHVEKSNQGFWAAPLNEVSWRPGTNLDLAGPLGHGFDLPSNLQRLGLVALGETVSRLLPLIRQTSLQHTGVALFTDLSVPALPAAIEVYPPTTFKEALDWPDFLALDVPLTCLERLRTELGLLDGAILPCPAQVLVTTPLPCAGLAQCGACAIRSRRGWKLVCEDGPVFDLKNLSW
jgi:NAD(P)H-flavin reductase